MPICTDCVEYMGLGGHDKVLTMSLLICDYCERGGVSCASNRDYGYPSLPRTAISPKLDVQGWYEGEAVFKYSAEAHDGHLEPTLKLEILDAGAGTYIQISGEGIAFDTHKEVDAFAAFLKSFLPKPIKHPTPKQS